MNLNALNCPQCLNCSFLDQIQRYYRIGIFAFIYIWLYYLNLMNYQSNLFIAYIFITIDFIQLFQYRGRMSAQKIKKGVSESNKRDLMWNIVQPGDPYDIRKSMIARLPGDKKFMGPHLEIICLLQAAEIQRLCLYLEQHQVKYTLAYKDYVKAKEQNWTIKELSDRLASQHHLKTENEKLKQFIRKQTIEMQSLQKQQNTELNRKYENSLRQIESMFQEKYHLEEDNRELKNDIRQMKDLLKANQTRRAKQFQTLSQEARERQLAQDQKHREYFNRWEADRKNQQKQIQLLTKKCQELDNINKSSKAEIQRYKLETAKNQQLLFTIKQYENRFQLLAEEIQRLNGVLRDKSKLLSEEYAKSKQQTQTIRQKDQEISQLSKHIQQLEQSNFSLQKENRQSASSLQQVEKDKVIIQSYEASLQKYSVEVDRLNSVLRKKITEVQQLKKKQGEYEARLKSQEPVQRQCNQYKYKLNDAYKKVMLLERQNEDLSLELQRLNNSLKRLIDELNQLKHQNLLYEQEINNLKRAKGQIFSQQRQQNKAILNNQNVNMPLRKFEGKKKEKFSYPQNEYKISIDQTNMVQQIPRQQQNSQEEISRQRMRLENNNTNYITEELMRKNRKLQLDLQEQKQQNQRLRKIIKSQNKEQWGFEERQTILKLSREIERLKDILQNKSIQNDRLSEINQKLRQSLKETRLGSNINNEKRTSQSKLVGSKRQRQTQEYITVIKENRGSERIYGERQGQQYQQQQEQRNYGQVTPYDQREKREFGNERKERRVPAQEYGKERRVPAQEYGKERRVPAQEYGKERRVPAQEYGKERRVPAQEYGKERRVPAQEYGKERRVPAQEYGKERRVPAQEYGKERRVPAQEYGKERRVPAQEYGKERRVPAQEYGKERRVPAQEYGKERRVPAQEYGKERRVPAQEYGKERRVPAQEYGKERRVPAQEYGKERRVPAQEYGKERRVPAQEYGKERRVPLNQNILIRQNQQNEYHLTSFYQPEDQSSAPNASLTYPYQPKAARLISNFEQEYYSILKDYERLTDLTEQLKLKLFNMQQQRQKILDQWSQKLNLLEQQNKQYRSHLDPTVVQKIQQDTNLKRQYSILLHKYNEITYQNQLLHRQIYATEGPKPIILDNSQDVSQLVNQNRQLKKKCSQLQLFHKKILSVNDELQRLALIIQNKDQDIASKQAKIQYKQNQIELYQRQIRELQSKPENQPLVRLQRRNAELQKLIKQYELNQSYKLSAQQEREKLQSKLQAQGQQLTELNNALKILRRERQSLSPQNRESVRQQDATTAKKQVTNNPKILSNYQEKIVLLSQEVQRLSTLLTGRIQYCKRLQAQLGQSKQQKQQRVISPQRINDDEQQIRPNIVEAINTYANQSTKLQTVSQYQYKLVQLSSQIDRLNKLLSYSKQKNDSFQNRQKKYTSQIQRLNNSLRLKVQESITSQKKQKESQQEKQYLLQKMEDIRDNRGISVQRNDIYVDKYEKRIKGLNDQIQRLQNTINNFKGSQVQYNSNDEIQDLIEKNKFLINEIQRLNEIEHLQSQDLRQLRLNYTDSVALRKRINEHLALFVVLFAEIQSLRNRVQQGEGQLVKVRKQNIIARKA